MSRITLPAELREKLLAAEGTVELTDEAGKVIGEFHLKYDLSAFRNDPEWPSEEELDRIEREEPTYTAEQVMEHLRKLTKCE